MINPYSSHQLKLLMAKYWFALETMRLEIDLPGWFLFLLICQFTWQGYLIIIFLFSWTHSEKVRFFFLTEAFYAITMEVALETSEYLSLCWKYLCAPRLCFVVFEMPFIKYTGRYTGAVKINVVLYFLMPSFNQLSALEQASWLFETAHFNFRTDCWSQDVSSKGGIPSFKLLIFLGTTI